MYQYPVQKAISSCKMTCNTCKRKMLIKRCHKTFTVEITVLISDGKWFVLTAFPKAVAYFFGEGVHTTLSKLY